MKRATAQREFLDIGNQFQVRNIRIARHLQGVLVEGEIFNGLQGFFASALFKVRLLNADCTYLGANNFGINEFKLASHVPSE